MITLHPYLSFPGTCEEAFLFYKSVFGGKFDYIGRYKDMPGDSILEAEKEKIMHISLSFDQGFSLFGADMVECFGQTLKSGNSVSLCITVESRTEADRIFNALSQEGTIDMPLEETFWGAYFGQCIDRFGIIWMINYDLSQK